MEKKKNKKRKERNIGSKRTENLQAKNIKVRLRLNERNEQRREDDGRRLPEKEQRGVLDAVEGIECAIEKKIEKRNVPLEKRLVTIPYKGSRKKNTKEKAEI